MNTHVCTYTPTLPHTHTRSVWITRTHTLQHGIFHHYLALTFSIVSFSLVFLVYFEFGDSLMFLRTPFIDSLWVLYHYYEFHNNWPKRKIRENSVPRGSFVSANTGGSTCWIGPLAPSESTHLEAGEPSLGEIHFWACRGYFSKFLPVNCYEIRSVLCSSCHWANACYSTLLRG